MPREWHDRHAVNMIGDGDTRRLYLSIVADKKPYFMRYIYPALMRQYNTYISNTNKSAMREFGMTVDELSSVPADRQTERQKDFLRYYRTRMPVGTNDCVMNQICRRFEAEFDGYIGRHNAATPFDYTIMKSGAEYSYTQYNAVLKLYNNYNRRLRGYAMFANYERVDEYDTFYKIMDMRYEFEQECARVCPNRFALCDIILDICYKKVATRNFAWQMCGDEIIHNLLEKNQHMISCPTIDAGGDIQFGGNRFKVQRVKIGGDL